MIHTGAIIYYLKAIPWQFPDFKVDKYYKSLIELHKLIKEIGYIDFTCHRFLWLCKIFTIILIKHQSAFTGLRRILRKKSMKEPNHI